MPAAFTSQTWDSAEPDVQPTLQPCRSIISHHMVPLLLPFSTWLTNREKTCRIWRYMPSWRSASA